MDTLIGNSMDCGNGNALKALTRQYDRTLALKDNFLRGETVSETPKHASVRLKANNVGDQNIIHGVFAASGPADLASTGRDASWSGGNKALLRFQPTNATSVAVSNSWASEFAQERKVDLEPKSGSLFLSRPSSAVEARAQRMEQVFETEFNQMRLNEQPSISAGASNLLTMPNPLLSRQYPRNRPAANVELDKAFDSAFQSFSSFKDDMETAWKDVEDTALEQKVENDDVFRNLGDQLNDAWQDRADIEDLQTPNAPSVAPGTSVDPLKVTAAEYEFATDNPYAGEQALQDAFEVGVRLMRERASLTDASLAFEAAVQQAQRSGNRSREIEAWSWLGLVQAENEKEQPAIAALQRAVQGDPSNLKALMALSASLTNEGADLQAFGALERWIHTQYPSLMKDVLGEIGRLGEAEYADTSAYQKRVTAKFLAAARAGPSQSQTRDAKGIELGIDADVQVGLGVLFYNAGDYEKAVDCFEAAVRARPDDYLLWNRLGATLANWGKSEEAISAYHRALSLKPTFVRGMYNLGVSCMNIGCYREAAEHFLGAIQMHERPPSQQTKEAVGSAATESSGPHVSDNLWEILRRTFILMDRPDLVEKAHPRTSLSAFKADFSF